MKHELAHRSLTREKYLAIVKEVRDEDCYGISHRTNARTIVDVGANVGIFSRYARALFPNAFIYAIEPNVTLFQELQVSKSANAASNCAVAWFDGTLPFSHQGAESHLCDGAHLSAYKCADITMVTCKRLTTLWKSGIDILKIDTEGSEYEIVHAMPHDYMQLIQYLTMEVHRCRRRLDLLHLYDKIEETHDIVMARNDQDSEIWQCELRGVK